jgi:hypothetical protein
MGVRRQQCNARSALKNVGASALALRPSSSAMFFPGLRTLSSSAQPKLRRHAVRSTRGRVPRDHIHPYSESRFAIATRNRGLAFSDISIS